MKVLHLTTAEYEHVKTTLEGCWEEYEELMREREWFVTELTDRIETALEILRSGEERAWEE